MSMAPQTHTNFPQPVPDSAGIPQATRDGVIVAPFNDIPFARQIIAEYADQLAGVIVEPLQRLVPPVPGFLEALREETTRHGIVLIFDEVVTGFRLALGGGQELYGVTPDLCTLGKVIGGGFPLAAIAGSADVMAHFDIEKVGREKFTFQIGTLSGNPVAAAAGLKTLEILKREGAYDALRKTGRQLIASLECAAKKADLPATVVGDPVLFDIVFAVGPINDYRDTLRANAEFQTAFNASLRREGILKAPMKFYSALVHTAEDIAKTEDAIANAMEACAQL